MIGIIKTFAKFGVVGVINTMISLFVYWLLIHFGIYYILATSIGYLSGIFTAYLLNGKFVFKVEYNVKNMSKFFSVYGISFFLNIFYMFLLVDILDIDKFLSQLCAIILNMIFNFIFSKIWVFK